MPAGSRGRRASPQGVAPRSVRHQVSPRFPPSRRLRQDYSLLITVSPLAAGQPPLWPSAIVKAVVREDLRLSRGSQFSVSLDRRGA
jgi:hypothetical protein